MDVADIINNNGWWPTLWQRFNVVPSYGRLVAEAVLEGIWPEDFLEQWSPKPVFEIFPAILISCMNLWRRYWLSRRRERKSG